jgi:hypothetical protein
MLSILTRQRSNQAHVRLWHKADIPIPPVNVRFWGQSGHRDFRPSCLVLTKKRTLRTAAFKLSPVCSHSRECLLLGNVRYPQCQLRQRGPSTLRPICIYR